MCLCATSASPSSPGTGAALCARADRCLVFFSPDRHKAEFREFCFEILVKNELLCTRDLIGVDAKNLADVTSVGRAGFMTRLIAEVNKLADAEVRAPRARAAFLLSLPIPLVVRAEGGPRGQPRPAGRLGRPRPVAQARGAAAAAR